MAGALSCSKGLGAGNVLLTPADGPLMAAAQDGGIASRAADNVVLWEPWLASSIWSMRMTRGRIPGRRRFAPAVPLVVSRRVGFPVGQTFLSRWKYGRASRYLAVSEHVKRKLVEAEIPGRRRYPLSTTA